MYVSADIIEAGKYMYDKGLAWGSTGNISAAAEGNYFYISGSGSRLGELDEGKIAICHLDSDSYEPAVKPSKEYNIHRHIYMNRLGTRAIVHTSPPFVTMVAAAKEGMKLELRYFIESMVLLRDLAWVPFLIPGSNELAEEVGEASKSADVIMMKNHGVIIAAETIPKAMNKLEALEFLCRMLITAKSAGIELEPVSDEMMLRLLKESKYKSYVYSA